MRDSTQLQLMILACKDMRFWFWGMHLSGFHMRIVKGTILLIGGINLKVNPTPKDLPKNTILFWSGDCLDVMSCAASLWRVRHVCWHLEIDEVAASNH